MADVVLIVEDDPSTQDLMAQMLHLEGFAPVTAADGREALQYLQSGGPASVILLDLMMPGMDGWAFRRRQLTDPRIAGIPIVIVTAGDLVGVEQLEADALLRKPIFVEELIRVVRVVCLRRGPEPEPPR